jgi:benzylsuccinate CoA-transferase BbsF subunit
MGPTAQALTGLTALVGLPGRPPAGWSFSYLDHVGGYLGAVAVLRALLHRRETGEGQHVDVSQLEPATALNGPLLLDFTVNGRRTRRPDFPTGNQRGGAPQGAFPCAGDDRWVVISCTTDEHRRALAEEMGVADTPGDEDVAAWTRAQDRYDVMHRLQGAGVPAGVVQDAADRLERDPQLAARGHFTRLTHAEVGELPLEGIPVRMSATPPATGGVIDRAPPRIGEDTDAVLRELLDLGDDEIAALRDAGALT